jgi:hypothetical protein
MVIAPRSSGGKGAPKTSGVVKKPSR